MPGCPRDMCTDISSVLSPTFATYPIPATSLPDISSILYMLHIGLQLSPLVQEGFSLGYMSKVFLYTAFLAILTSQSLELCSGSAVQ